MLVVFNSHRTESQPINHFQMSICSSSSFQTLQYSDKHSLSSNGHHSTHGQQRVSKEPEVEAGIMYDDSVLEIKLDISKITLDPYEYRRYYLVFDGVEEMRVCEKILQCYFDQLQNGDLMKIVCVKKDMNVRNTNKGCGWLEKTKNTSLEQVMKLLQVEQAPDTRGSTNCSPPSLIQQLDNIAKESSEFRSLTLISIFTNQTPEQHIFSSISQKTNSNRLVQVFTLLHSNPTLSPNKHNPCPISISLDEQNVKRVIELFLKDFKRMRLRDLEITLECLNGSLTEDSLKDSGWIQDSNKLVMRMMSLKCHYYSESLKIIHSQEPITLMVTVSFSRTNGDIQSLSGCFTLHNQQSSHRLPTSYAFNPNSEDFSSNSTQLLVQKKRIGAVVYSKTKNLGGEI